MSPRKPRKPPHGPRNRLKRGLSGLGSLVARLFNRFVAGVLLVGGLLGYMILVPTITVEPADMLDPTDPLTSLFRLTNESAFDITRISWACGVDHLSAGDHVTVRDSAMEILRGRIPVLAPKESDTISCPLATKRDSMISLPGFEFSNAEVSLIVSFETAYFWWRSTLERRFQTFKKDDGTFSWQPAAVGAKGLDPHEVPWTNDDEWQMFPRR